MKVVIVESPAKAKAINKYLGSDYIVLASYGHVRDLPSKTGSVDPEKEFHMVWDLNKGSDTHFKKIVDAVKKTDTLYLATDPDREGEAIAWHICEMLKEKKLLGKIKVYRSVFHEITKSAILEAINHPRELDQGLVDAYLARRALDYLVGFTLSPVLWHKLPGSKSAGRVQSVALRLVTDRDADIEKFISEEYWSIDVELLSTASKLFMARVFEIDGEKAKKFSYPSEASAAVVVDRINSQDFFVKSLTNKRVQRNPYPPFTTSTLQQEAARKLGYSASKTMQLAQHLYEGSDVGGETVGLITYMRTDSVNLGAEALQGIRTYIGAEIGSEYLPETPRFYKNKAKNAQEAHEAIRPTDAFRTPQSLAHILDRDHLRLYELVWKRALSSQMANALLDQVSVDISSKDHKIILRATGSTLAFDGFLKLYQESKDAGDEEEKENFLPPLKEGEDLEKKRTLPEQHFTQPPPRFTEASLVKKLEELGIGRPSTYASILQVLQARDYVRLEKKQFFSEDRGRLVSLFLQHYFSKYVEYDFTAKMEDSLDDISNGSAKWKVVLEDFWKDFLATVKGTDKLKITDVLDMLDRELSNVIFPQVDGKASKVCPTCQKDSLHLKLGKFGAFIGCQNYPECKYTHKLGSDMTGEKEGEEESDIPSEYPKAIGTDPETQKLITLRKGPYGIYLQLGDEAKPKRVSLPKNLSPSAVTLEEAVKLLTLPRTVGEHPETHLIITANIGRFGPYIKYGDQFVSLKEDDLLTVSLDRAVELIAIAAATPKTPRKKFTKKKS